MNVQAKTLALRPASIPTALSSAAVNLATNWKLMELTAVVTVFLVIYCFGFFNSVKFSSSNVLFCICFLKSFLPWSMVSSRIAATCMIFFPVTAHSKYPEKHNGAGLQLV